jgi:hypothetical protein
VLGFTPTLGQSRGATFCLIHVIYIILPCGFIIFLQIYRLGKEENKSNKMIVMGVENCNPSLGLTIKARACKSANQK